MFADLKALPGSESEPEGQIAMLAKVLFTVHRRARTACRYKIRRMLPREDDD